MNTEKFPTGFRHLFQDSLFLHAMSGYVKYTIVGQEGALGRRYSYGFFCIEYYTSEKEPVLEVCKGLRFVIWNQIGISKVSSLWKKSFMSDSYRVFAFVDISKPYTYVATWKKTLRNYHHAWQRQDEYRIEEISCQLYCDYYTKYAQPKTTIKENVLQMKRHSTVGAHVLHCYVLKTIQGDVVAGIATVDAVSVSQSFYLTAFTCKEIAPPAAGLWLCDHWMKVSSTKQIQFANLGAVWSKGFPESWKGFSDFKLKFNPLLYVPEKTWITFTFSTYFHL